MGFGILFIGYFLLLNVAIPSFTNLIAALIMLLGLSKLRVFNRGFKAAFNAGIVFSVFSAFDLAFEVLNMLMPTWKLENYVGYVSMVRYLLLCVFTCVLLVGIEEITKEVKLKGLPKRCRKLSTAAIIIYGAAILFEAPFFASAIGNAVFYLMFLIILATFVYVIFVLYLIYTCFARIGMPGEEHTNSGKDKNAKSRFSFVNEMRERKEERKREDEEYRAMKMQKKKERKAGKK